MVHYIASSDDGLDGHVNSSMSIAEVFQLMTRACCLEPFCSFHK